MSVDRHRKNASFLCDDVPKELELLENMGCHRKTKGFFCDDENERSEM